MSGTIPPIPPPFGASSSNPGIPNVNRVDMMPTTIDPINTMTTRNVSQSVVDEILPQLLDSRGGSHVINVLAFNKEDFTSWKVRFLVFLVGLEPYLLKTLEDGPFVPIIIISCLPNDVMKSVIKYKTTKKMRNDLILAHEGPSDTKDTKIAALRLKFNAFKSLKGEKVDGTFTRPLTLYGKYNYEEGLIDQIYESEIQRFTIQASRSKALISNHQFQDSDSNVEEDQRTVNEFIDDLNVEYHERALLANQKRFYKRSGKNSGNHQRDYKGLKAEMAVLAKRIDDMTKGKSEKGNKKKEKSEKSSLSESFDWDDESVSSKMKGAPRSRHLWQLQRMSPQLVRMMQYHANGLILP
ncbi:hypothetical protein Tco_0286308 [Tanacetum coccineum]